MEQDRENELRDQLAAYERALRLVVERGECWSEQDPCGSCSWCAAKRALEYKSPTFDWRYRGACHERVQGPHHPRERRIIHALAENVDDHRLSQILDRAQMPTANDWYVAASVVQWLATNVGMTLLEQAGFKYSRWDEDRKERNDGR